MNRRLQLELELAQLVRAREDELRYPVSDRDRRQWFKRTGLRVTTTRLELARLDKESDDEH